MDDELGSGGKNENKNQELGSKNGNVIKMSLGPRMGMRLCVHIIILLLVFLDSEKRRNRDGAGIVRWAYIPFQEEGGC